MPRTCREATHTHPTANPHSTAVTRGLRGRRLSLSASCYLRTRKKKQSKSLMRYSLRQIREMRSPSCVAIRQALQTNRVLSETGLLSHTRPGRQAEKKVKGDDAAGQSEGAYRDPLDDARRRTHRPVPTPLNRDRGDHHGTHAGVKFPHHGTHPPPPRTASLHTARRANGGEER